MRVLAMIMAGGPSKALSMLTGVAPGTGHPFWRQISHRRLFPVQLCQFGYLNVAL